MSVRPINISMQTLDFIRILASSLITGLFKSTARGGGRRGGWDAHTTSNARFLQKLHGARADAQLDCYPGSTAMAVVFSAAVLGNAARCRRPPPCRLTPAESCRHHRRIIGAAGGGGGGAAPRRSQ